MLESEVDNLLWVFASYLLRTACLLADEEGSKKTPMLVLRLPPNEKLTMHHLEQTCDWNMQHIDGFVWISAKFEPTIEFDGLADTISVADLFLAASSMPRTRQVC